MPLGGETVGTAYVRILADGSRLDESIKREFEDHAKAMDAAGEKDSERYSKAFEKEMESGPGGKRLANSIEDSVAKTDAAKAYFNSPKWRDFRTQLQQRYGEAGALAGKNLEEGILTGSGDLKGLRSRLNNITGEVSRAVREIQQAEIRSQQAVTRAGRDSENQVKRLNTAFEALGKQVERFARGEEGALGRGELEGHLSNIRKLMTSAGGASKEFIHGIDDLERRVRYANPTLERFVRTNDRIAEAAGRAFGLGSRNNLFNFFGILVKGLVSALSFVPRLIDKLLDLGQTAKIAFDQVIRDGGGAIQATFAAITATFETLGGALLVMVAAVAIGTAAIAALVTVGSLLLGIVTALTSALAFGLAGAIGVVVGALAPLVGAVGVVTLAFSGMNAAQKKALHQDFKPLIDQFHRLRDAARDGLFAHIGEDAKLLAPVVGHLTPLIEHMASAVRDVGVSWIRALHGPGYNAFVDALNRFLPNAIRSLGRSLGNAFAGVGGVFRALIPLTNRFLGWLQRVTGEFAKWANSSRGQKELLDFFHRAGNSLESVGNLAKQVGRLLGALFNQGQKSGNSIIDDMATGISHLVDYLNKHPHAVQTWFEQAKGAAASLGHLISQVGHLLDALDTPVNRKAVIGAITLIGWAAGLAVGAVNAFNASIQGMLGLLKKFTHTDYGSFFKRMFSDIGKALVNFSGFPEMKRHFNEIVAFLKAVPHRISQAWQSLAGTGTKGRNSLVNPFNGVTGDILAKINSLPGRIRAILSRLSPIAHTAAAALANAFLSTPSRMSAFLSSIPGRVRSLLAPLGGFARSAASAVANAFSGIAGRIASFFGGVASAIASRLGGAISAAGRVASSIVSQFAGLAGRILAAIGHIIIHPTIQMPHINVPNIVPHIHLPHIPNPFGSATGGVFEGLRGLGVPRIIGEAGPEAVVPLNRPLSQVDPAVRLLSAFAQGKKMPGMAAGGVSAGKTVDASGWTIVTPNTDTEAVAHEVLNTLVAKAV